MNTYQFTAAPTQRIAAPLHRVSELVNGESLEDARAKFEAAYPPDSFNVVAEELIHTDIPEEATAEDRPDAPEEPGPEAAETGRKLLAATERLQELGRLVSSLKAELEEQRCQRAEAERKLAEAQRQLAKVQEEAEVQQVRADSAAEEIVYLKAELYDCMTAARQ